MTAAAARPVRGSALFIAQCPRPGCPAQHRLTLPTIDSRPTMRTPLGSAFVVSGTPLLTLALAAAGTRDHARWVALLTHELICREHALLMTVSEVRGVHKPAVTCNATCWNARRRQCACSCAGRMHGSGHDTRPALPTQ